MCFELSLLKQTFFTMKKIISISAILIFSFINSFGQGIGLRAGYNYSGTKLSSDILPNIDTFNDLSKPISGFFVGVNYEIPLSSVFFLEPGLNFSSKGYLTDYANDPIDPLYNKSTTTLYYLDVPVLLKAKMKVGKANLFAGVGPYFSYGLFADYKIDGEKYDRDFSDSGRQRFDSGLIFTAGVEVGNFEVGASYQLGLVNIDKADIMKRKNRVASLSVGYRFGKKAN
jgi:hypothetical protein